MLLEPCQTFVQLAARLNTATVVGRTLQINDQETDFEALVKNAYSLALDWVYYPWERPDGTPPEGADLASRKIVVEKLHELHAQLENTFCGKVKRYLDACCWPCRNNVSAQIACITQFSQIN